MRGYPFNLCVKENLKIHTHCTICLFLLQLQAMKLILAPLANITHSGLRMLIHSFGDPDEYFTEMIHAPSLLAGGPFEQWYLRANPVPEKLVWQLTSPQTEAFVQALPLVLSQGGLGVDLNMGCSAPPIVRSGAGFAWMLKPLEVTAGTVRSVKKALDAYANVQERSFRLSVKLRLGTTADYSFLLRFCRMLVCEGVQLITIHPRLQRQSYGRPAFHEYTAALARDLAIPVYGNGDITSVEKVSALARQIPAAGWMIGRAAVRMPWIFEAVRRRFAGGMDTSCNTCSTECTVGNAGQDTNALSRVDLERTALLFLQLLESEQPQSFYSTRAQRFFQYYCENLSFAHYCRTQLRKAVTRIQMEQILYTYFEQVPEDRFIAIG